MKIVSHSAKETQKIARLLIQTLKKQKSQKPHLFALKGNLGAGKTTFIQGAAKALKIKEKVLSPTFIIMRRFPLSKNSGYQNFYHFDCYRLNKPKEILVLGFKEIISDPLNLIFIEWPERIKKIIPPNAVSIEFKIKSKGEREIIIKSK